MAALPPRKQSRNFTFSAQSNKVHKHTRIREYILYCCPTNTFAKSFENFWQQAKDLFNGSAHNYSIPHITLVSFFKVRMKLFNALIDLLIKNLQSIILGTRRHQFCWQFENLGRGWKIFESSYGTRAVHQLQFHGIFRKRRWCKCIEKNCSQVCEGYPRLEWVEFSINALIITIFS